MVPVVTLLVLTWYQNAEDHRTSPQAGCGAQLRMGWWLARFPRSCTPPFGYSVFDDDALG